MKKYSKQREAILNFLTQSKDHPTADVVYQAVRKRYPSISLGTIYRNLSLFVKEGRICSLFPGDGKEHFDGMIQPHYHLYCKQCQKVMDLDFPYQAEITQTAQRSFSGVLETHQTCFFGLCPECAEISMKKEKDNYEEVCM